MSTCIYSLYKTTNLVNNKIYYGVHKETKWPEIDDYLGSGYALKHAINKHGRKNFKREVLCVSDNLDYVYFLESQLVDTEFIKEQTNYNICGGGKGTPIVNEDTKERIRQARTGKKHKTESIEKMSEAKKGRTQTLDHIKKRVAKRKGYRHSEETKRKMSDAQKGKPLSDETRKKLSMINKGKKLSPETIAKRSATYKKNQLKKGEENGK